MELISQVEINLDIIILLKSKHVDALPFAKDLSIDRKFKHDV